MVPYSPVRFVTAILLSLSLAPGPAVLAAGAVQTLPAGDIEPPQITHTPLEEFPAGLPLRIQARVTDDSGVREVTLFYRSEGGTEYRRVAMRKAPGSNLYSADLPARAGPRIEYFIQASDAVGNTVLGRVFDPYVLTVLEESGQEPRTSGDLAGEPASAAPPAAPARPDRPAPGAIQAAVAAAADEDADDDGISRWVWVGLGVLALGALAASGGGGGGGEANPGAPPAGASGTGTVTITAPVP